MRQTRKIKMTEAVVRNLPAPEKSEVTYTSLTQNLTLRVLNTGTKTWVARIWNGDTGKVQKRKLGVWPAMTCANAVKALEALQREMVDAKLNKPKVVVTLGKAVTRYIDRLVYKGKSLSCINTTKNAWDRIPKDLLDTELSEVVPYDLSQLVSTLHKTKPGVALHLRRTLKATCKMALENEWTEKDRTLSIKPVRSKPNTKLCSLEELALVMAECRAQPDVDKKAAFLLLAATGQRGNEIQSLLWGDIDPDANTITVRAENRNHREQHVVPMNELAHEALALLERKEEHRHVFPRAHRDWISAFGRQLGVTAGVDFNSQQLRKHFISGLLSEGAPLHVVQALSGYKDAKVLLSAYAIANKQRTQEAIKLVNH